MINFHSMCKDTHLVCHNGKLCKLVLSWLMVAEPICIWRIARSGVPSRVLCIPGTREVSFAAQVGERLHVHQDCYRIEFSVCRGWSKIYYGLNNREHSNLGRVHLGERGL